MTFPIAILATLGLLVWMGVIIHAIDAKVDYRPVRIEVNHTTGALTYGLPPAP